MDRTASVKGRNKTEGLPKKGTISPFWIGEYQVTHHAFGLFYKDERV
jgi:formylglycine-generating enzyme required for sulfatase activity